MTLNNGHVVSRPGASGEQATQEIDARREILCNIGLRSSKDAERRSAAERANLLRMCARGWDGITIATLWYCGVRDTVEGETYSIAWAALGWEMAEYAGEVVPKGAGVWMTPAISSNGRCRDQDITEITQLGLDADGAGDWDTALEILRRAGLAFIAARSSGHTPARAKFHVHLPLAEHWFGEKAEWRQMYRHTIAWLSVAFGLARDVDADPPRYGFDHATDRLGQPWFFPARRTSDASVPEVITADGMALDMEHFLVQTGYAPQYRAVRERERRSAKRRPPSQDSAPDFSPTSLLECAFAGAGWLGPRRSNGTTVVMCPWTSMHTTGAPYDGSTVLFPATEARGTGWFHCAHSHCVGRTQRDVLLALPPAALQRALRAEGGVR